MFSTEETEFSSDPYFEFCNGNMTSENEKLSTCEICNVSCKTENCAKAHERICGKKSKNSKGRSGYYCPVCKRFYFKEFANAMDAKKNHKCEPSSSSSDSENYLSQQCPVEKPREVNYWPNLAFFSLAYKSIDGCSSCKIVKENFREKENLTWAEFYKLSNCDLRCDVHSDVSVTTDEPNLAVFIKEVKRGVFKRFVVTEDELYICDNAEASFELQYYPKNFKGLKPYCTKRKSVKKLKALLSHLDRYKELKNKSLMQNVLLLITQPEWQNTVFLSHNANNLAHQFIIRAFMEIDIAPKVIESCSKVNYFQIEFLNLAFLNASTFINGTLLEWKRMFNIEEEMHFFPEIFNFQQKYDTSGCQPDLEAFVKFSDTSGEVEQKKIFHEDWRTKNFQWTFKKELLAAVESEAVVVFKTCCAFIKSCFEFQSLIKEHKNLSDSYFVHPFESGIISISGYTFKVCNHYFLRNYDIFTVPFEYSGNSVRSSKPELEFAAFKSATEPEKEWIHQFNAPRGQKSFGRRRADLYSPVTKEVHQFFGCNYHYHVGPDCKINQNKTDDSVNGQGISFANLKKKDSEDRDTLLANYPNEIINYSVTYECEWKELKKSSQEFENFRTKNWFHFSRPLHRLVPRTAVRSGLSDVYKLRWEKDTFPTERFIYADVQGLYSSVAIDFEFPIGQFEIFIGPELTSEMSLGDDGYHYHKNIKLVCGAAHVKIWAPDSLEKPFLQYRIMDKFNFLSLCKMCCEFKSKVCRHKKTNFFESTWMLSDLRKAVSLGYKIEAWYEIHYFPKTAPILREYSKLLYSEKIKHSGYPSGVVTAEEKKAYCDFINNRMELPPLFCVKPETVKKNDALRQLAKNQLNNFYGKFSQNSNQTSTMFVNSQWLLDSILSKHRICDINNVSETMLQVEYETTDFHANKKSNIYIGAQISAYGREVIYDHMMRIEQCGGVIYSVDVDGIFFSLDESIPDPLTYSNICGDFKKMVDDKSEIVGFYCLGSRNYSLLLQDGDKKLHSVVKIKGLSLSSHALENVLSAGSYKKSIGQYFENEVENIVIPKERFCIDRQTKKM